MGLQSTKIDFVARAEETVRLLQRGTVAILLKANSQNVYSFKNLSEAKAKLKEDSIKLSAEGDKALEMVFRGAINRPYKINIAFCNDIETINSSLQIFEGIKFDWFCAPEFEAKNTEIVNWIKILNEERNMEVKAVISNTKADSEFVVNFTSKKIILNNLGGKNNVEVTPALFTSRVASALAGTPLTRAITNLQLDDVASVERLTNNEYDTKINAGELVLYNDWDKVRFGRGVTSITTMNGKSEERKKILIISKMHMWKREVKELINNKYLGAVQNGINEKMLLITSIKQYNAELVKKGVILGSTNENDVDIDITAQEKYLKVDKNIDTSNWTEKEIRDAKTGSYVFIKANLEFTDAMEDIQVTVSC
ncbi:phage tail sheath subtilisin-like domain-containing protein [Peptostreptococcus canis]|uniref:Tail sheath protein subtilisin-like domain-containing protein n=1 Tax=Peptostreptococcus canis TaxID=1159213 RepID=A0ABR6TMC9_9FIRM|nr:phage tail sheath subtilisin-like domain-containing protein [Peptostreptococcus canis]MBC2576577.1 hypothetical protein [Peptostreptococcus canis]MBP1998764.1 hypothetical protein [Peptostreptococcus canis]